MDTQTLIALVIFIGTYAFIVSEKIDRTAISFLGASCLILFGVLNEEEAIHFIDFNTIGLLVGMIRIILVEGARIITAELSSTSLGLRVSKKSAGSDIGFDSCNWIILAIVTADMLIMCLHRKNFLRIKIV